MNPRDITPPSTEPVLALIRGELSSRRRWAYRILLAVISVWMAALVSLWGTEPGPLPLRLHLAFSVMTLIGLGWIGVLTGILTLRNCPTAFDRLATGWMAAAACLLFLAVSVVIALVRGQTQAALSLGVLGVTLLAAAVIALGRAYRLRARLRTKLAEMEGGASAACK